MNSLMTLRSYGRGAEHSVVSSPLLVDCWVTGVVCGGGGGEEVSAVRSYGFGADGVSSSIPKLPYRDQSSWRLIFSRLLMVRG